MATKEITQQELVDSLLAGSINGKRNSYNNKVRDYLNGVATPQNYMAVIAICIVLKLSLEESELLLNKAGLSINKFSKDSNHNRNEILHYSALVDTEAFDTLAEWNDYFVNNGASTLTFVKNANDGCEP